MSDNTQPSRVKTKKTSSQKKKGKLKTWQKVTFSVLGVLGIIFIGLVGLFAFYASSAPSITEDDLVGTVSSTIYDKDGNEILKLGTENRILIDANDVPPLLENAVLSVEDRRFYDHNGVDIIRIVGAMFANVRSGELSQGGSTITQQLIKLSVFSTAEEDRTLKRKAQEAWLAVQLEQKYTKRQILTFYMNKVYLANNTYGFATAAKFYYNKTVHELTLPEAALLAGMPQAPNHYDPYVNPEQAKERRDIVLKTMLDNQKITEAEYNEAVNTPITAGLTDPAVHAQSNDTQLIADSYLQRVITEVTEKTGLNPYTDGIQIYTNLDMNAQKYIKSVFDSTEVIDWVDNDIQSGMAVVNPQTGAIVALMGGRNIQVQMGFNRATQLNRSSGSTIKPIIDYAPTIELLNYSTGHTFVDEKTNFSNGDELNNFDYAYKGPMTMREALVDSRNTTAYKALMTVGLDKAYDFIKKLGFRVYFDGDKEGLVENNSIGVASNPLQMASAFSAFSNGGTYYTPFAVSRVVTMDGKSYQFDGNGQQAMKDSTAYMITDMLKGVPKNNYANISGLNHAGKTGSTNYTDEQLAQVTGGQRVDYAAMDSWYIGYTPHYAVSVWVGYDTPLERDHYLGYNESGYAQRLYKAVMTHLSKNVSNDDWKQPASVEKATIVKHSNPLMLANQYMTNGSPELFVKGTVPKQVSPIKPQTPTGLKAEIKDEKTVELSWDRSPINGVVYDIEISGHQSVSTSENKYTVRLTNPVPNGELQISLRARLGSQQSDPTTTKLRVSLPESSSDSSENSSSESSQSRESIENQPSQPVEPDENE